MRRLGFSLLWVGFICYAFFLAPPDRTDTFALIQNLSLGRWDGIDPTLIALFNAMGVWPLLYACVLFADGRGQPVPAWPFAIGSFFLGAFALLPYLALRQPNPEFFGNKNWLLEILDARIAAVVLAGGSTLLAYVFWQGDWTLFATQWQNERFVNVMGLDFCLLCLLFPVLVGDDARRRGAENPMFLQAIACFPLVGALAYLLLRPPLPKAAESGQELVLR